MTINAPRRQLTMTFTMTLTAILIVTAAVSVARITLAVCVLWGLRKVSAMVYQPPTTAAINVFVSRDQPTGNVIERVREMEGAATSATGRPDPANEKRELFFRDLATNTLGQVFGSAIFSVISALVVVLLTLHLSAIALLLCGLALVALIEVCLCFRRSRRPGGRGRRVG